MTALIPFQLHFLHPSFLTSITVKKEALISIPRVFNSQLSYSNALSWTVVKLAVVIMLALLHDTDPPLSYGFLNALMVSLWLLPTHMTSKEGYRWYAQYLLNLLTE